MNKQVKESYLERWGGGLALGLAALLKIFLLWVDAVPFNADEAIVALMARHILEGARPLFFYGQAYLGSLDAWLLAGGFALLGQHVWVIRTVQGVLYLGTIWTTVKLGEKIFSRRVGNLAAWLLALPVVNVTLYTTASLGGYGEALLLGNLILLLTLKMIEVERAPRWQWFLFGFLAGFGLWVFGLTLVFSAPAGLYLLGREGVRVWKGALSWGKGFMAWLVPGSVAGIGFLVGGGPYWVGAGQLGGTQVAAELGGSAIAGVEGLGWFAQLGQHVVSFLLFGPTAVFGLRPPWEVRWLGLPLIPFILLFWGWVLVRMGRAKKTPGQWLLIGVMLTLVVGFVFTPFGADPSGRYFLPLAVPLGLFAGAAVSGIKSPRGQVALMALVLGFHVIGTVQAASKNPPGITTQFDAVTWLDKSYDEALIAFLREHGETRGYTNYWVAYPLAFLSEEDLVFIPALPYHLDFRYTARDDRYAPYAEVVAQAARVAYITTNHLPLEARLQAGFADLGVSWEETQIGNYHVFYNLSRPVRPTELDLAP